MSETAADPLRYRVIGGIDGVEEDLCRVLAPEEMQIESTKDNDQNAELRPLGSAIGPLDLLSTVDAGAPIGMGPPLTLAEPFIRGARIGAGSPVMADPLVVSP
jgi:hypothetical protein